jgi:hypothetical protein
VWCVLETHHFVSLEYEVHEGFGIYELGMQRLQVLDQDPACLPSASSDKNGNLQFHGPPKHLGSTRLADCFYVGCNTALHQQHAIPCQKYRGIVSFLASFGCKEQG